MKIFDSCDSFLLSSFYATSQSVIKCDMFLICLLCVVRCSGIPLNFFQSIAENGEFEKSDNYLPKTLNFPRFHYNTFGENPSHKLSDEIHFKSLKDKPESTLDLKDITTTTNPPETTTVVETTTNEARTKDEYNLDPVLIDDDNSTTNRTIRQEEENNEVDAEGDSNTDQKASQEDSEEEDGNMITGLISAFLGGLSRPDGSVDVEAITGLLGSLSTQNDDGSYDFNGLTELLMSFFGGEENGSDFGAFLGGILGAFIKGVAKPPGSKGTGIFLGNLLGGVLPALSAPAPTVEGGKPAPALDSGGFLGGLLSSISSMSGALSQGSSGGETSQGGGSKFSLFKAVFSIISSFFTASFGSKDHH